MFNSHSKAILKQTWKMTLPLLLSALSGMLMLFVDRVILAYYSLDAHNAAVESMSLGWVFLKGGISLATVVQIFVAQNYGAGHFQALGKTVWQMIWVSLFSCLFFWTIAIFSPSFLFEADGTKEMQKTYLFWMVSFGPAHVLFTALASFFTGQGKTRLVSTVIFIGNVINSVLCYLLVFGWGELIPSIGIQGSAISTNAAVFGQILILGFAFFNKYNRENFGTKNWHFDFSLVKNCFKVGLPNAIFGVLEVAGWAIFYKMMAGLGTKHLTVAGIVQNILILVGFFGEGLAGAVAILAGNAIGAKHPQTVFKFVHAGFILMTLFAIGLALFIWLFHSWIIGCFLCTLDENSQALFYSSLVFGLGNVVIYKYLEGIRLIISGALTAAADTFFLLIGGTFSIWLFMVIPVYSFVVIPQASIETALTLCSIYTLFSAILYSLRFYQKGWQKNHLLVLQPLTNATSSNS